MSARPGFPAQRGRCVWLRAGRLPPGPCVPESPPLRAGLEAPGLGTQPPDLSAPRPPLPLQPPGAVTKAPPPPSPLFERGAPRGPRRGHPSFPGPAPLGTCARGRTGWGREDATGVWSDVRVAQRCAPRSNKRHRCGQRGGRCEGPQDPSRAGPRLPRLAHAPYDLGAGAGGALTESSRPCEPGWQTPRATGEGGGGGNRYSQSPPPLDALGRLQLCTPTPCHAFPLR